MSTSISSKKLKMLQDNYEYMLNSPSFIKLKKKNKKLKYKLKMLNRVIIHMGSLIDNTHHVNNINMLDLSNNIVDLTNDYKPNIHYNIEEKYTNHNVKNVYIKEEPTYISEYSNKNLEEEIDDREEFEREQKTRLSFNMIDIVTPVHIPIELKKEEDEGSDDEEEEEDEVEGSDEEDEGEEEEEDEEEGSDDEEEEDEVEGSDEEEEEEEEEGSDEEVEYEEEEEVEYEEEEVEYEEEEEVEYEEEEEDEEVEYEEEEVEYEEEEDDEEVEYEEEEEVEYEEEEEEVYEVTIKGTKYFTSDSKSGEIYSIDLDGDPGDVVGKFVSGTPKFNK